MAPTVLVLGAGPMRDGFFLTAARMGVATILVEESAYSRYDRLADENLAWRLWQHGRPGPDLARLDTLRGRVDAVIALNDWATPIAADLAHRWGLAGPGSATATRGHDKAAVRGLVGAAGLDGTRCALVRHPDDVDDFLRRTGSAKVVLKPVDGGASLGVRVVSSRADASAALPEVLAATGREAALVEEFVDGDQMSLEGVVRRGEVVTLAVTEKLSSGAPRFIELRHLVRAEPEGAQHGEAVKFVGRLAEILRIEDAVVHVEANHTGSGWRLIEVALRPAGGLIADLVREARGIDLYEESLRLALGMPPAARGDRPGPGLHAGIQFVAGRGTVADFASMAGVRDGLAAIRRAERLLPPGTSVPDVSANWWRAGYVSGVSPDLADLRHQLGVAAGRLGSLLGLEPMSPDPAAAR